MPISRADSRSNELVISAVYESKGLESKASKDSESRSESRPTGSEHWLIHTPHTAAPTIARTAKRLGVARLCCMSRMTVTVKNMTGCVGFNLSVRDRFYPTDDRDSTNSRCFIERYCGQINKPAKHLSRTLSASSGLVVNLIESKRFIRAVSCVSIRCLHALSSSWMENRSAVQLHHGRVSAPFLCHWARSQMLRRRSPRRIANHPRATARLRFPRVCQTKCL